MHFSRFYYLFGAAISCTFIFSCGSRQSVHDLLRVGDRKFDSTLIKSAWQAYKEATETDPDFDSAWFGLGMCKHHEAEFKEAIKFYSKAIELNPKFVRAYNNRGLVYGISGNPDAELKDYNTAISLDPGYHMAFYNRGNYWLDRKEYKQAMEDYNKAITLFPKYAKAFFNRAEAFTDVRNYTAAIDDYNTFINLMPGSGDVAEALYLRGNCRFQLNDEENACTDWNKAKTLGFPGAGDQIKKHCK